MQLERLGEHLAKLAALMDRYQKGDLLFPEATLDWLNEAEKAMGLLRLPEGAEMSALRGRILKAEDAAPTDEGKPSRGTVRRARNAAAAEALDRAESILRRRVLAAEERLKFFEEKLCEGMTAFLVQNELPPPAAGRQAWLLGVWDRFREFKATRPLALYLNVSLSQTDRCYVLDQVLGRLAGVPAG